MHINKAGLRLVEEEEAFIPFVYDDFVEPRTASDYEREWKGGRVLGTLTIGYGTTMPKSRVAPGTRCDRPTAEQWLAEDLREAERDVARLVKVPLNENQFSALVSFVYNAGPGTLQKSTLLRLLNAGNYDAVPRELAKFVNSKGKPLRGLVRRRAHEAALWSRPVADAPAVIAQEDAPLPIPRRPVPTETDPDVPLATVEPDAVTDKSPEKSKTLWVTIGGIFSTVGTSVLSFVSDYKVILAFGAVAIVAAFLFIGRERMRKIIDQGI